MKSNLKVYINGRFLANPITGINRFAYEICLELSKILDIHIIVPRKSILSCYDVSSLNIIEFGCGNSHLWEQLVLPCFFLFKNNYLLVNFSGLGPILVKKKVITIHDVSFLHNPKWFSKKYYILYKSLTPISIRTSRHIFTVSNFSKCEILKYYPFVNPNKVSIVYNATKIHNFCKNRVDNRAKTILTVGSLDPRKNLTTLTTALEDIALKDVSLRVIGGINNKVFKDTGVRLHNNVKLLGRVNDKQLQEEYFKAKLFVLPSLYEGFGIPPLEALSYGTDIAVSDIPVFHEIFEDAAIYFNPNDANDIAEKIRKYMNKTITVNQDSKERILKKFSWSSSAKIIQQVLSQI